MKNHEKWDWSSLESVVNRIKSYEMSQKEASDLYPMVCAMIRFLVIQKEELPNKYDYDLEIDQLAYISAAVWRISHNLLIDDLISRLESPW